MSTSPIHLRHPAPLVFVVERLGREFTLPLPTRGQMRRALELDPERDEVQQPADMDARRALQLSVLAEASDLPLSELTVEEEVQILHAIMAAHHGFDPTDAVAWQQALEKKKMSAAALNVLGDLIATPVNSRPA